MAFISSSISRFSAVQLLYGQGSRSTLWDTTPGNKEQVRLLEGAVGEIDKDQTDRRKIGRDTESNM